MILPAAVFAQLERRAVIAASAEIRITTSVLDAPAMVDEHGLRH